MKRKSYLSMIIYLMNDILVLFQCREFKNNH